MTLREAAQQALEALEIGYDAAKAEADQYHAAMAGYRQQCHAKMDADVQKIATSIAALRAALAEPVQEPVAWGGDPSVQDYSSCYPEPEQEPVAWMDPNSGEVCRAHWLESHAPERDVDRFTCALYTAPPQRKPLTEEEINALDLPPSGTATVRDLVHLIERAHGIGGGNE